MAIASASARHQQTIPPSSLLDAIGPLSLSEVPQAYLVPIQGLPVHLL